ncbi:MAG: NAD(P)/FAD-dependent oxidoreductase [Acidimicrobiales bacterium]
MNEPRIVVIGGGPTGLGAAHRLHELGHTDWVLLEGAESFGGLASSVVDKQGFTWDLGGHVLFSHYEYFDKLTGSLLGDAWLQHVREAWVRMRSRWVPYPFQNNIWRLPDDDIVRCLHGLLELTTGPDTAPPETFDDWILQSFGTGIADVFMRPYNFKVWAYEPSDMNVAWMGDRVATVDLARVLENLVRRRDDVAWGPNATFRFPATGGTGAIWTALAERLPADRLLSGHRVCAVNPDTSVVTCENGEEFGYDALISTMPLDILLGHLENQSGLTKCRDGLRWSSSHIIGIGIDGDTPEDLATKCWMYFPEDVAPFYRATVFSNYSPANVANPGRQWSLMCEVAESIRKPVDHGSVVDQTRLGLEHTGLVSPDHEVVSEWHRFLPHGYPTPFLGRDALLAEVEPRLRAMNVFTRGRFGGWKYEVSNQDHSLMQGVECVDHILDGSEELTYFDPVAVNGR